MTGPELERLGPTGTLQQSDHHLGERVVVGGMDDVEDLGTDHVARLGFQQTHQSGVHEPDRAVGVQGHDDVGRFLHQSVERIGVAGTGVLRPRGTERTGVQDPHRARAPGRSGNAEHADPHRPARRVQQPQDDRRVGDGRVGDVGAQPRSERVGEAFPVTPVHALGHRMPDQSARCRTQDARGTTRHVDHRTAPIHLDDDQVVHVRPSRRFPAGTARRLLRVGS